MATYRLDILVTGTDRATPQLSSLGRALGRIGQIAFGILVAGTIRALTGQLFDLGQTAIESYSNFERMQVSLQSLIARELARGEEVETTSSFIRDLSEAEQIELDKLIVKYDDLGNELLDLIEIQKGLEETDIEFLRTSVAIRETTLEMQDLSAEIERMQALNGAWITTTETSLEKTMGLAEALDIAAGPAKELTDWIVRLSLKSPFEESDILMALRVAAGYGFITQYATELATEEDRLRKAREDDVVTAQRLTVGLLDLMAAIGLPSENLQRIVLALGQVRAHGKLLAQEIRQLVNAGVGVDIMAMAMGMTVEQFMNAQKEGEILAEDFLPKLIKLLEEDLAGSAERIMNTFGGALLSLRKFREVALRTFFGPTFAAITPALRAWVDELTSVENLAKIEAWGIKFRDWLITVWDWARKVQHAIHGIREDLDYIKRHGLLNISLDFAEDTLGQNLVQPVRDAVSEAEKVMEQYPIVEDPEGAKKGALIAGLSVLIGPTVWGVLKRVGPKIIGILLGIGTKFSWVGIVASIAGFLIGGNWERIKEGAITMWENVKPKLEELRTWLETNIPLAMEELKSVWINDIQPKLQEAWVWIEENILPTLREWARIMKDKITEAAKKVKEWVVDELWPKLVEFWEFLRDDLIPTMTTLALETFKTVGDKAVELGKKIGAWVTPKIQAIKDKWEEVRPSLEEFAVWLGQTGKKAAENFGLAAKKFLTPPIALFAYDVERLTENNGPLDRFWKGFEEFKKRVAPDFKAAWDEYVVPIWDYLTGWFSEHVMPLVRELVRLFGNIQQLFILIGGKAWEMLHKALGKIHERFFDELNPAVDNFWKWINKTYEAISGWFSDKLVWFKDNVLIPLRDTFDWIGEAIDSVTTAIGNLNDALEKTIIPKWAEGSSPPPLAYWMWDIANATKEANDAWTNSIFAAGGQKYADLSLARLEPAGSYNRTPPVYIEGDRNTFYVADRSTWQFIEHQIDESKKRRFSEYMGRM